MKKKWLEQYSVCQGCSRGWDMVTHSAKGLCRGCARKKQHTEGLDKQRQKWSKDYDHCQGTSCPSTINGVTSQLHNADGLCQSCYSKAQRYIDHGHSIAVEAVRRNLPENKEKQKEHFKNWYEENKKSHNKITSQWNKNNREMCRDYEAQYRETNREIYRASCRKWYEENPEKAAAQGQKQRQENPEQYRQYNRNRRAKLAGLEGSFTTEEWVQLCEEHDFKCYQCGTHLEDIEEKILTPDHLVPVDSIDIVPTNDIDNIGPLCGPCNSSKRARSLFDFNRDYLEKRAMKLISEGKEDHCVVKMWRTHNISL